MMMENYDVLVVGGGIIGIASALTLKRRHCDLQIGVVESESVSLFTKPDTTRVCFILGSITNLGPTKPAIAVMAKG